MKDIIKLFAVLTAAFTVIFIFLASCDDTIEDNGTTTPDTVEETEMDKIADGLVFKNALKIAGDLGVASNGFLKTNVKDTMSFIEGLSKSAMFRVTHRSTIDITGFYVKVTGASFYYDVPEQLVYNGQFLPNDDGVDEDTISVIIINEAKNVPENGVEVIIQPHDETGAPRDEFKRVIHVEKQVIPPPCPIATSATCTECERFVWRWIGTEGVDQHGEIFVSYVPGVGKQLNDRGWGCCRDGVSSSPGDDPSCTQFSDYWWEIEVNDFYRRDFALLWLFDDGTFDFQTKSSGRQYDPGESDFCNNMPFYVPSNVDGQRFGTFEITQNGTFISFHNTSTNISGWNISPGFLIYTCNRLVIVSGLEQTWYDTYERVTVESGEEAESEALRWPSYD